MSTAAITLCVAIATFILQEGITNIIHGIIFRFLSKVKIGDRIDIVVDGVSYTGTVSKRTIRHIIINDIQTNAEIIIPNYKIDLSVIKNSYNGRKQHNKYIVELPVSYADAENEHTSEFIKQTIRDVIEECELITTPTPSILVYYRDSYVGYSFFVITSTIENNFAACSYVREKIMQRLAKNNIHIPYNTMDVSLRVVKN